MIDTSMLSPGMQVFHAWAAENYPNLVATSGHRSPEHNTRVGGARHSQHLTGGALDYSAMGMTEAEKIALIQAARGQGMTGVGVYDNSLHFDQGPERAWGPDYTRASLPGWAAPAFAERVAAGAGVAPPPVAPGAPAAGLPAETQPEATLPPGEEEEEEEAGLPGTLVFDLEEGEEAPEGSFRLPGTDQAIDAGLLSDALGMAEGALGGGEEDDAKEFAGLADHAASAQRFADADHARRLSMIRR